MKIVILDSSFQETTAAKKILAALIDSSLRKLEQTEIDTSTLRALQGAMVESDDVDIRKSFVVQTPAFFSELEASTLNDALKLRDNFGTTDKKSEYFLSAERERKTFSIAQRFTITVPFFASDVTNEIIKSIES